MPLRDHFRPPTSDIASWEELHGAWPASIAYRLNAILPPDYRSGVKIHVGNMVDFEITALEQQHAGILANVADGAVSCRSRGFRNRTRVEAWEHELAIGSPLPTLPLWLSETLFVRVELERTYEETCQGLRIA